MQSSSNSDAIVTSTASRSVASTTESTHGYVYKSYSVELPFAPKQEVQKRENLTKSLFIGNLGWWTTDAEMLNCIAECGVEDIVQLKFAENRVNGLSKGYCAVEVASEESYQKLFRMLPEKSIGNIKPRPLEATRLNQTILDNPERNPASNPPPAPTTTAQTEDAKLNDGSMDEEEDQKDQVDVTNRRDDPISESQEFLPDSEQDQENDCFDATPLDNHGYSLSLEDPAHDSQHDRKDIEPLKLKDDSDLDEVNSATDTEVKLSNTHPNQVDDESNRKEDSVKLEDVKISPKSTPAPKPARQLIVLSPKQTESKNSRHRKSDRRRSKDTKSSDSRSSGKSHKRKRSRSYDKNTDYRDSKSKRSRH